MPTLAKTRLKTIAAIITCLLCIGCATISNPPNFDNNISQHYVVDDVPLVLQRTAAGGDSVDAQFLLDTTSSSEEIIFLNVLGYDLYQSRTSYYDLTRVLFGLSAPGCCDLKQIATSYSDTTYKQECINNRRWIYYSGLQPDGDFFAGYSTPFNNRYVLFLNMRIDKIAAKDSQVVENRLALLDKMITSSNFRIEGHKCSASKFFSEPPASY